MDELRDAGDGSDTTLDNSFNFSTGPKLVRVNASLRYGSMIKTLAACAFRRGNDLGLEMGQGGDSGLPC